MYRKILQNLRIKESPHFLPLFLVGLIAAALVSALPAAASDSAEFILGWDANDEADLDGYEIYVRTGFPGATYKFLAAVYVDELEDPDNPTVTITDLYNGLLTDLIPPVVAMAELANNSTYHFALTAFDTQGNTSDFSEELCVEVIGTTVVECGSLNNSEGGGGGAGDGGGSDGPAETDTDSGSDGGGGSAENDAGSDSDGGGGSGGGCFIAASSFGFRETVVLLLSPF